MKNKNAFKQIVSFALSTFLTSVLPLSASAEFKTSFSALVEFKAPPSQVKLSEVAKEKWDARLSSPEVPQQFKLNINAKEIKPLDRLKQGPGVVDGGGGMQLDGDLLDFAEARKGTGLIPMKPSTILGNNQYYRSKMATLGELPELHFAMNNFFGGTKKLFYFQNQPIETSNVKMEKLNFLVHLEENKKPIVVAFQDETKVIIYKPWFDQADDLEKVGLLVHEYGIYMSMRYGLPHDNAREFTRLIFAEYLGGTFEVHDIYNYMKVLGFSEEINAIRKQRISEWVVLIKAYSQAAMKIVIADASNRSIEADRKQADDLKKAISDLYIPRGFKSFTGAEFMAWEFENEARCYSGVSKGELRKAESCQQKIDILIEKYMNSEI